MIGQNAFGHVGYGGSSATFADPDKITLDILQINWVENT